MKVAIIPARGGSKRILRKNIRPFAGKPIISYSIEAARRSNLFDRIMVSTDDSEIARIAMQLGAEVPFIRPERLSGDHVATIPVVRHAIDWLQRHGQSVEHACCIYAAAPFVRVEDLDQGYENVTKQGADFSFPVCSFPAPIFRALQLDDHGKSSMFWPEHELTRSQDLPEGYFDAGQFYWGTAQAFRSFDGFFGASSVPVNIPRYLAQDIDTPEDWENAELLYELLQRKRDTDSQTPPLRLRKFAA